MPLAVEKLTRHRDRAMASFIIDDVFGTTPGDADAYKRFSEWVEHAGLRGEASALLGYKRSENGRALPTDPGFAAEVARASHGHLDAFMEVMSHQHLYDFAADRMTTSGPHEGVWMLDVTREVDEYLSYFENIARRAQSLGFRHAGLTIPGCGCAACVDFKKRNHVQVNAGRMNPNVYQALLKLLKAGQLEGLVCGLFIGAVGEGPADVAMQIEDGAHAVYDIPPGVRGDHFGRWDNDPQYIKLDHYLSADGRSGRLPELLAQGSRTLIYYGHWQSLRPDSGVGFAGFQEIAARLKKYFASEIVWMRPTEIAAFRHTERHTQVRSINSGRAFSLAIPFAPLHALTFRVRGSAKLKLRSPSGVELAPREAFPGEACALFEFLPENGRYEILEA